MPLPDDQIDRYITEKSDGKKELKLHLDMHEFHPDEVSVTKDRNKLEVHAYHEEKKPTKVTCKVFEQKYSLPKSVRLSKMESKFDGMGTLTVKSSIKPRQNVTFAEGKDLEQLQMLPLE